MLRTGDGDLTMRVQDDDLDADIELQTSDGNIDLSLPVTVVGRARKRQIHGRINGGGKLISLKTGDGSIRLQKL